MYIFWVQHADHIYTPRTVVVSLLLIRNRYRAYIEVMRMIRGALRRDHQNGAAEPFPVPVLFYLLLRALFSPRSYLWGTIFLSHTRYVFRGMSQ